MTVSASLPPSPGRLKAAWQSRGSGGGGRRAGRRHRVMAEMREGESRYFISEREKGKSGKKKRAREKQLQARLLLSPHLSCVLEENELQLIKTVCAAAAVEKGKQHLCRRDTNFVISSSVIEQQGFLFCFYYLKRNEGEKRYNVLGCFFSP